MYKNLVIVLIIAFNAIFIAGCVTISPSEEVRVWPNISAPSKKNVNSIPLFADKPFTPKTDGLFLDINSANNLMFNLDELDAYIAKQEALIKEMKRYYKAK